MLLTIRYLVDPRQRRATGQQIWEATLDAFAREDDIDLAYPTTRFYSGVHELPLHASFEEKKYEHN